MPEEWRRRKILPADNNEQGVGRAYTPIPSTKPRGERITMHRKIIALLGTLAIATLFAISPARAWSGCGVQIHGGHAMGEVNGGGPIGLSSTGQLAGASVFCDLALGKSVVVGAFVSGEKTFGDFDTLGINHGFDIGGRAGILLGPNVLAYGHAAWTRVDVDGLGQVDGWKWGPGVEVMIPDSAWSLDFRYQISDMDVPAFAGADTEVRTFRLGLAYKFGGGKQVESIFTPEVSKPCDPKLGNCKR